MADEQKLPWVKLYMEPQSERSLMPPFVIGILTKETPGQYVLVKVLDEVENDETGLFEVQPTEGMRFYSKTYVYCLEMMAEPPQLNGFGEVYNGEGGLG